MKSVTDETTAARLALRTYLRQRKLRCTPERLAILDKVFATDAHFFADVIYEALGMDGFHVSLSTVYATMQLLVDAGLVRCHRFRGQPAQYERIVPGARQPHIHLVCNMCGKVREVRNPELIRQISAMRFGTFRADDFALYVNGLCSRCRRRK